MDTVSDMAGEVADTVGDSVSGAVDTAADAARDMGDAAADVGQAAADTARDVGDAAVAGGQAVAEGALAYQVWREPLRRLALATELSDLDAGVLKQIVPDIGDLLDREIPDVPELQGQDGQQRLLSTIVDMFREVKQPVLFPGAAADIVDHQRGAIPRCDRPCTAHPD